MNIFVAAINSIRRTINPYKYYSFVEDMKRQFEQISIDIVKNSIELRELREEVKRLEARDDYLRSKQRRVHDSINEGV